MAKRMIIVDGANAAYADADYFVLRTARENDAQIVTNDQYEEYQARFDIEKRRVPFMIVQGTVELYWPDIRDGRNET